MAYREDAARLALRDLLGREYGEVGIPSDAVQPYYDALVLVHNATGLPARDSVTDVYPRAAAGATEVSNLTRAERPGENPEARGLTPAARHGAVQQDDEHPGEPAHALAPGQ